MELGYAVGLFFLSIAMVIFPVMFVGFLYGLYRKLGIIIGLLGLTGLAVLYIWALATKPEQVLTYSWDDLPIVLGTMLGLTSDHYCWARAKGWAINLKLIWKGENKAFRRGIWCTQNEVDCPKVEAMEKGEKA